MMKKVLVNNLWKNSIKNNAIYLHINASEKYKILGLLIRNQYTYLNKKIFTKSYLGMYLLLPTWFFEMYLIVIEL